MKKIGLMIMVLALVTSTAAVSFAEEAPVELVVVEQEPIVEEAPAEVTEATEATEEKNTTEEA